MWLFFALGNWEDDLRWDGNRWHSIPQPRSRAKDPHQLRINRYRVLLTRGRDGFLVYIPAEMNMDLTFNALKSAGVIEIDYSN